MKSRWQIIDVVDMGSRIFQFQTKSNNIKVVQYQAAVGDAVQTPIDIQIYDESPSPERRVCKKILLVSTPSPILRKLPTSKTSSSMALQHQALVRTAHGIVVQPLDSAVAAPQTHVVKPRYGEATPAVVESSMFSIDESWTEFTDFRGRYSMPRKCMRIVDVIFPLAVLCHSIGTSEAVGWRTWRGGLARDFTAGSQRFDKTPLLPAHEYPIPVQSFPPSSRRQSSNHVLVVHVPKWRQFSPIKCIVGRTALEAFRQQRVCIEIEYFAFKICRYAACPGVLCDGRVGIRQGVLVWV